MIRLIYLSNQISIVRSYIYIFYIFRNFLIIYVQFAKYKHFSLTQHNFQFIQTIYRI